MAPRSCVQHARVRTHVTPLPPVTVPQALKASREARNGTRLVGFAASNLEYVEHVFKQDTVGLQTKEQFAEKVRARRRAGAWRGRPGGLLRDGSLL